MRIVQIAPFVGGGSGLAGVAWNLDQQFRDLGAQVETFTLAMARRGRGGPGPRRPLARRIARAWRTVWFSTVGTVRARRFLAERPDAFSICHDDVLAGDIYVSHGVLAASMKARGQSTWRTVRRPMHVFAYLRDLYRFRSRTHRAVVALSTAEETALRDTYGRIHAPVVVIPNGVDLEQFRPPTPDERASARAIFRLDIDARVAIFVGHEFERKGVAFAIEGLLHAPTVMLLVVGGTAEIIDAARTQAESLGVAERVLLVGPRYDLPLFFAASDMFVLPSAYESNALVVLEALASGLPVVATPVGFAPEIIEDGINGFLVARDARAVGEGLEQLADADLDAWRQRARASAEPYAWRRIAAQYLELAERLRPDLVKP